MIDSLKPTSLADEFEAIISSAEFSSMSSTQLREKTAETLELCGHTRTSGFDIDKEATDFVLQPSWRTHPDRWMALRLIAEDYFSGDDHTSEGEKEEPDEETDESADADADAEDEDDEGSAAEKAIESVVGKFSKKKEVDEFLLGTLPRIPIIGWPVRILIFAFEIMRSAWNWFLDFLTKIAERLDIKNNLVASIDYVARISPITRILVIVIATTISYFGFILFAVILPLLRIITDPLGRLFRTIRKRLNRGSSPDEEDSDDESGVPT
jgi:hypothetical protein